jgi:hypothetical protein
MKTENKMKYIVIMYLLVYFFALCIAFHVVIHGVQFVQEIQDSHLAAVNNEYNNSGDGNNNTIISKITTKLISLNTSKTKSSLLFYITETFSIIFFIQIRELYFNEFDYLSKINKRTLIAQKIRLNN